ncbi:Astacin-like metalloendopeptidase [Strongyloides ratti]|uniref:Metalloendopeptidase n=1 Tax=Strongyloides ratti TaxID=34506 RepID=A0A090MNS2_STRRB|nr:Astacin-like metalloendopeptidase [Strongyloides ratti]CEF59696.2 Astacin-like metalloendopeptidase [Strongyloides ratti]
MTKKIFLICLFFNIFYFYFLISKTISTPINIIMNRSVKTENNSNAKKIVKRDILLDQWAPWNVSEIQYFVQSPVSQENVKKAIEHIENNTCIKFKKVETEFDDKQGLIFKEGDVCSSNVGLINPNKSQPIKLSSYCYDKVELILHEIGHALGLIHEQSRSDRDDYIAIDLENVKDDEKHNFQIMNYSSYRNYSTQYDVKALMHYKPTDFAKNTKKPVITSKLDKAYQKSMGYSTKMTFNEIKQLNLCHCNKCNWVNDDGRKTKTNGTDRCRNGGYPDHNDCNKCICPTGYTGTFCKDIEKSDAGCPDQKYQVLSSVKNIYLIKEKKCYIFLQAIKGKKIKLQIISLIWPGKAFCTEENSNQIKYFRDKGNTGLLLCGIHYYIELTSQSNSVLIVYRGQTDRDALGVGFIETD